MAISPLPVSIITGFLGAGKTTFLNRLLADPAMADTLVIVNEFGEIGLDHLFIETQSDTMILMASGCLCCTIRGDLLSTLEDIIKKYDTGALSSIKRIMIETTGLADPAPILQSLIGHPMMLQRYQLAHVITLVDAVNGAATLDHHPEAVKQVAIADRLLITKSDLRPDTHDLKTRLKTLAPAARMIDANDTEFDPVTLVGSGFFDLKSKSHDIIQWINAAAFEYHDHHNDHASAHTHHHHDVNRHDVDIRAFCFTSDDAVSPAAFEYFLSLLRSAHGENLLRLKGIVKLDDHCDRPVIIHGVQHIFHPPLRLAQWPDHDHRTRLVFITKALDENLISRLWEALIGRPGIDTPDRDAIMHNPLSLRRD